MSENVLLLKYGHYVFFRHASGPAGATPIDMNVAASLENPAVFEFEKPPGKTLYIGHAVLTIQDAGIGSNTFGGLGPLANGCKFEVITDDGEVCVDFLDGYTIKTNADLCLLDNARTLIVPGMDSISAQWTFSPDQAFPFRMCRERRLRITIQDDLSSINVFRAIVRGYVK